MIPSVHMASILLVILSWRGIILCYSPEGFLPFCPVKGCLRQISNLWKWARQINWIELNYRGVHLDQDVHALQHPLHLFLLLLGERLQQRLQLAALSKRREGVGETLTSHAARRPIGASYVIHPLSSLLRVQGQRIGEKCWRRAIKRGRSEPRLATHLSHFLQWRRRLSSINLLRI